MMSPTYFGLLAEFGAAEIPLEECCEKYFSLSVPQAKRKAMQQKLPVKVYRGDHSQKAGWLIDAKDLAEWLDSLKAKADKDHAAINGSSGFQAVS
jgi:hypothetical protein